MVITMFSCADSSNPVLIYDDFGSYDPGAISELETDYGIWRAEEENAEISASPLQPLNLAIHLIGGDGRAIELWIKDPDIQAAYLVVTLKRMSRQPPDLLIERYDGSQWSEMSLGSQDNWEDQLTKTVTLEMGSGPVQRLRFSSVTPENTGLLIDNLELVARASMKIDSIYIGQAITPVLRGKLNNPVLQVKVRASGHFEPISVNQLEIGPGRTDDPLEIRQVRVFFTGPSDRFSEQQQFGGDQKLGESVLFNGSQELAHGINYFWVSYELESGAELSHTVDASCKSLMFDNNLEIKPRDESTPITKRIGHALRQHDEDGVDTYRIPGLATTNNGTLIAVYDIRRNSAVDLQADVDVGMNRSSDGGNTWEPMKVIMDMGEYGGLPNDQNGIGDPAILVDRQTNTIWVAAVWAHGHPGERNWWASKPGLEPEETSQFVLVRSEDDGVTWSDPINITKQIKDPKWHLLLQGPGKGITLTDGTLVFPAQFKDENQMPHSTIIFSKDRGANWKIGTGAKSNTTEAQVVELADGSLMLNMRDNRGSDEGRRNGTGARSVAITKDLGKTWIEHPTSRKALPEPVCMASLIRHKSGEKYMLLFSNPANQFIRKDMTLKLSTDEGTSWPSNYFLLLDEGRGRGYSCLTIIDPNTVGILYEGSQADMVFQKIDLKEVLKP